MELKTCRKCKTEKPLAEFHKDRGKKDGIRNYCKCCSKSYKKAYRETNTEKIKAWGRVYRKTPRARLLKMRENAKKRGIEFLLTDDQAFEAMKKPCTYCGKPGLSGIDRKDSTRDYTLDNSVPCCYSCNTRKGATKSPEAYILELKKEKGMIESFPFVDEQTKENLEKWLNSQKAEELSQAFKYESCGNLDMAQRCRYKASTFENILIHIKYHMEKQVDTTQSN